MPNCPEGFSQFIETCIEIPATLPKVDFATAASTSGCLVDGKKILQPKGFFVFEALKHFFLDTGLSSSFWIGQWEDVQKDPYHVQVEWSEDGKDAPGECVIADVQDKFKWTRSDCSITAAYLCELWRPNCPNGYTFVPSAGENSCFKITEKTVFEDDSNKMYPSIATANKMCLRDGTSLAAPRSKDQIKTVWDWVGNSFLELHGMLSAPESYYKAFMGFRSFKEKSTIPSSCSSCLWEDHYYSPWTKNIPNDVTKATIGLTATSAADKSCTAIQRKRSNGALTNIDCYKSEATNDDRAVCEYRGCRISDDKTCVFPFRVSGRLYDKCTTVGTSDQTPWCSLEVDHNQNHISGKEAPCPSDCLYSDCPVGFWPHLGTCLQDSSTFPADSQTSIKDAEEICLAQGARLYQPRSTRSLSALAKRTRQFYDKTYKPGEQGWNGILGWAALQETAFGITMEFTPSGFNLKYRDGSPVPVGLTKDGLEWKTDFPEFNESKTCINFVDKGLIVNSVCNGYSDGAAPYLSYICEAKPFTTIDGDDSFKACHFPFKITPTSNWSHSCVYDVDSSGASKVWCATEVDEAGVVKDGKTGVCEDERNTAFAGPGKNG